MADRDKVINQLNADLSRAERTGEMLVYVGRRTVSDAIELLKEQESHLMTAEEVQNVDLWDFCYLEEKRLPGNEYRTACGEYKLFWATWPRITQAKQEHGMENYGKTWRCWTAGNVTRPSTYDRKHTAWD